MKNQPSHLDTHLTAILVAWSTCDQDNQVWINRLAIWRSCLISSITQLVHPTISVTHVAKVWITNPIQLADGCKSELLAFDWIDQGVILAQLSLLKVVEPLTHGLETTGSPRCDAMQSILFLWCMCEWGGQRRYTLFMNSSGKTEELTFPLPRRPSTHMESLSFDVQRVPEPATAGGL